MSKHTERPWKIVEGGSLHLSVVSEDDEKTIADVWFIRRSPQEGVFNARLIAAAPDLLRALKLAEPHMHKLNSPKDKADYSVVRDAIAKATKGGL